MLNLLESFGSAIPIAFTALITVINPLGTGFVLSGTFIGLVCVAIVVYLCYVYSYVIEEKLGPDGAHALNRIMAFVTLCIGLQILWAGIQGLAKTL